MNSVPLLEKVVILIVTECWCYLGFDSFRPALYCNVNLQILLFIHIGMKPFWGLVVYKLMCGYVFYFNWRTLDLYKRF